MSSPPAPQKKCFSNPYSLHKFLRYRDLSPRNTTSCVWGYNRHSYKGTTEKWGKKFPPTQLPSLRFTTPPKNPCFVNPSYNLQVIRVGSLSLRQKLLLFGDMIYIHPRGHQRRAGEGGGTFILPQLPILWYTPPPDNSPKGNMAEKMMGVKANFHPQISNLSSISILIINDLQTPSHSVNSYGAVSPRHKTSRVWIYNINEYKWSTEWVLVGGGRDKFIHSQLPSLWYTPPPTRDNRRGGVQK